MVLTASNSMMIE
jgi:hypothetical protein